jgi:hyperosmotically inducible protein
MWAHRMNSLSRLLLVLTVATASPWLVRSGTAFSEQQDKEKPQEKSSSQPHQSPVAPDLQSVPPKLSVEPKPQPQVIPPAKAEAPPDRDVKEKEKEKEPAKKPVVSLILTVKLTLLADSRLFHYEIEVGEDQQTITLTGRVSNEEEKAAASDIARTVPGVKAVINKLDVSKELAQAVTKKLDELITQLIKEQFGKSATLKAANFEVKTEEGIVSLGGAVRFQVIALEAAEAARHVPGVRAVKTEKVRLEGDG